MKQPQYNQIDTVQVTNYLRERVLPILQPLQVSILQNRPNDIKSYCHRFLLALKLKQQIVNEKGYIAQPCQAQDQLPQQVVREMIRKRRKRELQGREGFRIGVSGQTSLTMLNYQRQSRDLQLTFQQSQMAKIKILVQLRNSILFKNMDHPSLLKVIDKMGLKSYQAGDIVIRQGDDGNQLFIVDQGLFRCVVTQKQLDKIYGPGQAFGELALLYNTKRASTIIAETDGKLYTLSRMAFNMIVRQNVIKKTQICEKILSSIDIFHNLDRYEKSKVYQALQQTQIAANKYIIKQGQLGDCFYIVAEGMLVAQKMEDDQIKPVYYFKEGDYFGQLAIIKNIVRQASVKTLTKVRLLYIERSTFKRLLGSIQTTLKKNQTRYTKNNSKKKQKKKRLSVDKDKQLFPSSN